MSKAIKMNKNKPKFYKAVLVEIKGNVLEEVYQSKSLTMAERMGDPNATCPECGENHWWLLPNEGCAVREGGKPYCECINCGYGTHL